MVNFSHSIQLIKYFSIRHIRHQSKYKWLWPLILGLVFLAMCKLYWRKSGNTIVDYGREVYIPWQLSSGEVLYRDIDYVNGALAPYCNALWFKIFGVSITTLFISNLIMIAILTYIIYQLINRMCDKTTAALSSLVFLIVFAFSHSAIFNFVSPYDHNLIYGFFFTVLMINCLFNYQYRPKLIHIVGAGLCFGLAFLTKIELFSAALMTAIVGIIITQRVLKLNVHNFVLIIITFLGSMLLPILSVFIYFSFQMPLGQAIRGLIGNWYFIFNSEIVKVPFYQMVIGTDKPLDNILLMLMMFIIIVVLLIAGLIIEFIKNGMLKDRKLIILIWLSLLLMLCPALYFINFKELINIALLIGRPLPLLSLIMIAVSMLLFINTKNNREDKIKFGLLIIWSIFSFVLLWKIILNSKINGYGFVLAIPGMLTLIILATWLIPKLVTFFCGQCYFFRKLAISCFIILLLITFIYNNKAYERKTILIGKGQDRFYVNELDSPVVGGKIFNQMGNYIETSIPAQATLLVIPEGAMINYLTRHASSIPLISFTPGEYAAFGEPYIINSLKKHPPDFIVLVQRPFFGYNFGTDWGEKTLAWVKEHYTPVLQLGSDPLRPDNFGMRLLKLNYN